MHANTRFVTVVAVLLLSIGVCQAQEREWQKAHYKIELDEVMAEYTEIVTRDFLSPDMTRTLYRDSEGVLLVIRETTHMAMQGHKITDILSDHTTITQLSNGEEIVFDHDGSGTMTVSIGSASLEYVDSPEQRPLSQSVNDQARSMLAANASQGFQAALLRFADVAGHYSNTLSDLGSEVEQLFAPIPPTDVLQLAVMIDLTSDGTDVVIGFDPNVTPPGPFEQQFGQAYYE